MNYLFVVAHPDDETLGAGGTIYNLSKKGHEVSVAIMCSEVKARANVKDSDNIFDDTKDAMNILGVKEYFCGSFENIKMNVVPHLDLVKFIEDAIMKSQADIVITHHASDLNNDHLQTCLACRAAVRIFQRRNDVNLVREFMYMEVPSATDWALSGGDKFVPNYFYEIGKKGLEAKIKALESYSGVMREYPHPRSVEAITGLAAVRGAQSKLNYAEAFESVYRSNLFYFK